MPCVSMFYGLMIYMYNAGNEHNPPHFHVIYNGENSTFDFEGNLKEGTLPKGKQKLISAWAELHREELEANWALCLKREQIYKIDPLK